MNLPNLARRMIIPLLAQHPDAPPKWKGWHIFRRSLASNLYSIGVAPKIIQAILRHSDIGTTLSFYVETSEAESRDALDKLTSLMG